MLLLDAFNPCSYGQKGGTIRGSLNLQAQSLYPTIPALYAVLSQTPIHAVVWYCGTYGIILQRQL
jgi:hypothetical protein